MATSYETAFWMCLIRELFDVFDDFDDRALTVSWHPQKEFLDLLQRVEDKALKVSKANGDRAMRALAKQALISADVLVFEEVDVKARIGAMYKRTRWRVAAGWRDRLEAACVGPIFASLPDGD